MNVVALHPEPTPEVLPGRPRPTGSCIVPGCADPTRLYPGGWLCDAHKPRPAPAAGRAA